MNKKICRKVNRRARQLNKQLKEDVFGNRFWARQYQKTYSDGVHYFMYELIDNLEPERNRVIPKWFNEFELIRFNDLWLEMNNFIVNSDFWELYRNNK